MDHSKKRCHIKIKSDIKSEKPKDTSSYVESTSSKVPKLDDMYKIHNATSSNGESSSSTVHKLESKPRVHQTRDIKTETILVEDDDKDDDVLFVGNFEFKNEGPDLCCICFDKSVNSVLVPCGHLALCYCCAEIQNKDGQNRCPICRSKVDLVIKTYKP